jgi:hypothetical protein
VDSALSRKYEGTGLGLPLTKKFVEIMGGTFRIESELNVGTTITITIPLTPPRHVMKAAAKAHADADNNTEKQISPRLMEHAQASSRSLLAGTTDTHAAKPARSLLAEVPSTPSPAADNTAEQKITLIRSDQQAPVAPPVTPVLPLQEHSMPQPLHTVAPPAQSDMPHQPVKSLVAGKSLSSPADSPAPAPIQPQVTETSTPTQQVPHPAPTAPEAVPPQPLAPSPMAGSSHSQPASMPVEANTQTPPAPAQDAQMPQSDGSKKFMSYADLKRMAQQQNGS